MLGRDVNIGGSGHVAGLVESQDFFSCLGVPEVGCVDSVDDGDQLFVCHISDRLHVVREVLFGLGDLVVPRVDLGDQGHSPVMALRCHCIDALLGELQLILELDHLVHLPVHRVDHDDAEDPHGKKEQRTQQEAGEQLGVDRRRRTRHHVDERAHPTDGEWIWIWFRRALIDRVCHVPPT